MSENLEERKLKAAAWFRELQNTICDSYEAIEKDYAKKQGGTPGFFERHPWDYHQKGGGISTIMRGQVFEKVAVNFSEVMGDFHEKFRAQIPGAEENPAFWATGISLIAHMKNPHVPAVHMNTRQIVTTRTWFGGGADLTPYYPQEEDTQDFHEALKKACDDANPLYYPKYKKWCDEYFFLPHRQETRGVGGIFYDYHDSGDWEADFSFTKGVGKAFAHVYGQIVRRRMEHPWTPQEREYQLIRRGRYVEFNLLYDRGTKFGLETGGNVDSILASMPPEVKWP